ncbi:MAG: MaoC family dehydratase [Planctomycetota bacterium]
MRDFAVGDVKEMSFTFTDDDVDAFCALTGDDHPVHVDAEFARSRGFAGVVCHGLLATAKISTFVGRDFLGDQGLLLGVEARYRAPIYCGRPLRLTGTVATLSEATGVMKVNWSIDEVDGGVCQDGTALCLVPRE